MQINTRITPRWFTPDAGGRFRIRPINGRDRLELMMQIEKRGETAYYPASAQVQAIHACLLEWDVTDEDGNVAAITANNISMLDELLILDLFSAIRDDSKVSEEDSGNSESQSK